MSQRDLLRSGEALLARLDERVRNLERKRPTDQAAAATTNASIEARLSAIEARLAALEASP